MSHGNTKRLRDKINLPNALGWPVRHPCAAYVTNSRPGHQMTSWLRRELLGSVTEAIDGAV